ncbi:MAG: tetratricopeptide repeat protein [Ardenticatenaceae bacterium]
MSLGNGQVKSVKSSDTFQQALRLLHQGRAQEAITLLEPLYKRNPDNLEVSVNLSGAYILEARYDEARDLLEKAAQQDPNNVNVWVNLGAARLSSLEKSSPQQQEQAIEAYQQALALDPKAPNVHYMLGLICRVRKEKLRATAHFTRALEQNPNDKDARRMLQAIAKQ